MIQRIKNKVMALICALVVLAFPVATVSFASTNLGFTFDTAGELANNFSPYISSGSVSQTLTGGINNSGAINAPSSANAVFTSKSSYSLGPVGSSYTFASYMQSVGNSGYSGMGFTAFSTPSASNTSTIGSVFRPNDALGVSVHGGGFVVHNGVNTINGNWNGQFNPVSITNVKSATLSDLLNSGSPTMWYKIILKITRDTTSTFDLRIEVWPSAATGTLLRPAEADAIFEIRNQTNSALTSAASINTYINFSGDRVRYFDGYGVDLAGGSSVIQSGTPVVLTTSVTNTANDVFLGGNVTGDGGSSVSERGFVYSTAHDPTTADTKVVSGSGTGTFAPTVTAMPNGTFYFRAFATNSTGTSYGVEQSVTLTSALVAQAVSWAPTNTTATTNANSLTPSAAASTDGNGTISYEVNSQGGTGCAINGSNPPLITYTATGTCVVRAKAAANSTYSASYKDVSFTFTNPQSQTVTWAPTNTAALVTASPITPDALATTSGNGAISYSVFSAGTTHCSVHATTGVVTALSAGTCVVRATAASNATFAGATKDISFEIGTTTTSVTLNLDAPVGNVVENAPVNYSTTGLQPGSSWNIVLRSTPQTLASGNVGALGALSGSNVIPSGLEAGWHSITFTGTSLLGGVVTTTVWFEVSHAGVLIAAQDTEPIPATTATLSYTGFPADMTFLVTVLLMLLGGVLVSIRRIRSR